MFLIINSVRRVVFWNDANGSTFVLSPVGSAGLEKHPLVVEDCTVTDNHKTSTVATYQSEWCGGILKMKTDLLFFNSEQFQQVVYARAKWHHWSGENYYRIVVVLMDRKEEKMPLKIFTMSILRRKALQHARVGWWGRGAAAHFQVLFPNHVLILKY